jgi:RsiW-degrading membrane proteinase PrsW (M82 family)
VIVAAGGAFLINTFIGLGVFIVTGSEAASSLTTSALVAPVVEEILKGFAVVLVFLLFNKEFDSTLDGIVYAGVTALGFAAAENAYYIYTYGFAEEGWQGFWFLAFIRLGLVGWQHPFYTAFVGIGLASARLNRNLIVKLFAPVLGFIAAMSTHALHNILASFFQGSGGILFTTALDWTGWLIMLGFIILVMFIERQKLKTHLKPEVERRILTQSQYETATSFLKITRARIKAIFQGNYLETTRFYRKAAELSLKKNLRSRLGEEKGNGEAIQLLRDQVAELSKAI